MSPTSPLKTFLLAQSLVCLAVLALAPPEARAGYWSTDATLGAGIGRDNNPRLLSDQEEISADTVFVGTAGLSLGWQEGSDVFSLSYGGRYYNYSSGENEDLSLHALTGNLRWTRILPFTFDISEALSIEPKDTSKSSKDVYNLIQRNELSVTVGNAWNSSPTLKWEPSLRGALLTFPGEEGTDTARILHAEVIVHKGISPTLEGIFVVGATYENHTVGLDEGDVLINAGGRWQPRRDVMVQLGLERRWSRDEDDARSAYWLGQFVAKRESRGATIGNFQYSRMLRDQPDGTTREDDTLAADWTFSDDRGDWLRPKFMYSKQRTVGEDSQETEWGPGVAGRLAITSRLALDAEVVWSTQSIEDAAESYREDLVEGRCSLIGVIGSHFTAEAGYSYGNNDSEKELESYTSQRFFLLVTYYYRSLKPRFIPASTGSDVMALNPL